MNHLRSHLVLMPLMCRKLEYVDAFLSNMLRSGIRCTWEWLGLFLVNVEDGVTMLLPLKDFVGNISRRGSDTMLLIFVLLSESFAFFRFFPDFPDLWSMGGSVITT